MADPAQRACFTFQEYVELEEASNVKHEYFEGQIYAMAGGTPDHAALASAVTAALVTQLRGRPCRVFSSDLRVRVATTGLATYPDVTVVYGPLEHDPNSETTVTNPTIVVEVLSDSTEKYDRGEKRAHYQQIETLKAYVLVSQKRPHLELWARNDAGTWDHRTAGQGQHLHVTGTEITLPIDEIYRDAGE